MGDRQARSPNNFVAHVFVLFIRKQLLLDGPSDFPSKLTKRYVG